MSVSGIINPATGKIYDELVGQGGGISLQKGQIITADGSGTEIAFPTGTVADGSVLSYDSNETSGLKYIAIPSAIQIDYQELLSANNSNNSTIVPAPAQNGYVLTANNDLSNTTGLKWEALGGTGKITGISPIFEQDGGSGVSNIYLNFSGNVGEIPYGNGTAKTGAFTNIPSAGQILGISNGVPTWIPAGGSGTVTATLPLKEESVNNASNIYLDFSGNVGELVVGSNIAKEGSILSLGTNGYFLQANSNNPKGLEWVAGGSGGLNDGSIMGYNSGVQQSNLYDGATQPFSYGIFENPTPSGQAWTQTGLGTDFTITDGTPRVIYNPQPVQGQLNFFLWDVTEWMAPITLETGQKLVSGTLEDYNTALSAQGIPPVFEIWDNSNTPPTGQALYQKTWSQGDPDFPPFGGGNLNWGYTLNYTHTAPAGTYWARFRGLSLPWGINFLVTWSGSGPVPPQPNPLQPFRGSLSITTKDAITYTGTNPVYVSVNIPVQINPYIFGTQTIVDLLTVAGGGYQHSNFIVVLECLNTNGNPTSTNGTLVLGASNITTVGQYEGLLSWNGFMLTNSKIQLKATTNYVFNQGPAQAQPIYTAKIALGNLSLYACECGFTPLS